MADTTVATGIGSFSDNNQGLWGPYWISTTTGLIIGMTGAVVAWRTTDGGATWSSGTTMTTGTNTRHIAAYFDKETPGNTGTLVHMVCLDNTASNFVYRTIDISDLSLGTERTVASSLTVGNGNNTNCYVGIARSGRVYVGFYTASEFDSWSTDDGGATWDDADNVYESTNPQDWCLAFPANTGDDDDMAFMHWDASANEISVKMYDASATAGSRITETSVATGAVEDATHNNWDGAVRHSDGHIIVAHHNDDDTTTDDIECHDVNPNSIASPGVTSLTNVADNIAESAQCCVLINQQNDDIYVGYLLGGTWVNTVTPTYKKSDDDGTTWGSPVSYGEDPDDHRLIASGRTVGNNGGFFQPAFYDDDQTTIYVNLVNDVAIAAAATNTRRYSLTLAGVG